MKQSLSWHKECLKNAERSHQQMIKEMEYLQKRLVRSERCVGFYRKQIKAAELQGRDSFDSERFLLKRGEIHPEQDVL